MHPLYGALPAPLVPVRVTLGALVTVWFVRVILTRLLAAEPRMQDSRTFIPLPVSLWNDLANPVFDGVGQAGFENRANVSVLA